MDWSTNLLYLAFFGFQLGLGFETEFGFSNNWETDYVGMCVCVFCYSHLIFLLLRSYDWDFRGGPVVKTSPSNAGGEVRSLVGEPRSHMPHGQKTKT